MLALPVSGREVVLRHPCLGNASHHSTHSGHSFYDFEKNEIALINLGYSCSVIHTLVSVCQLVINLVGTFVCVQIETIPMFSTLPINPSQSQKRVFRLSYL